MSKKLIIAVDFDGTLVSDQFPGIGKPIDSIVDTVRKLKNEGHKLILWTCREDGPEGTHLANAVDFCSRELGIEFDAVNENLPDSPYNHLGKSRKVYADYYIDDKAISAYGLVL